MNDEELITAVRGSVTGVHMDIPAEQIVRRSRAIRARRRVPGVTATLAVVAVAVATLVPAGARPAGHRSTGPASRIQTDAYVVSRTEVALRAVAGAKPVVLVEDRPGTSGASPGRSARLSLETWFYGPYDDFNEVQVTSAGQIVYARGVTETSDSATTVDVFYRNHVWWRVVNHFSPGPVSNQASTCADVAYFTLDRNPVSWASDLEKALSCGQYRIGGTEKIAGVSLIKMVPTDVTSFPVTLWVDPRTYLPVWVGQKVVQAIPYDSKPPLAERDAPNVTTMESVRWLQPTRANIAKAQTWIPDGFTLIPPPPRLPKCGGRGEGGMTQCLNAYQRAERAWNERYFATQRY
jgi:hypothetical protein